MALRNLLRHPGRTLATTLGVALGIAAVLATLSVGDNVQANVRGSLEAAAGKATLLVTPGAQGRAVFVIDDILETVATTPGVTRVYPVLNTRAEPLRDMRGVSDSVVPGLDSGFQLSGRVTEVPDDLPAAVTEGAFPLAGSRGIVIADGFARTRGIRVGDALEFASSLGTLTFTVTGLLDDSIGYGSTNGGRVGLLNLQDLQEALRLSGRASFFDVMTDPGVEVNTVRERLETRLGETYAVTLPATSGDIAFGIVGTLEAGLRVLAVTLMALGGFMAYNTFAAGVVERLREYALLRTICFTRGQVQRLALLEGALVSLLGVVVGLALGVLMSALITRFNAVILGFEYRTLVVPGRSVLIASVLGVVVSLFAAYLPARAASRTRPIVARGLSSESSTQWNPHWGWPFLIAGVIISLSPWRGLWALFGAGLAMGLLFLGVALVTPFLLRPAIFVLRPLLGFFFGTAGRLGAGFTLRNAARNGVAIGAVIVGMGLTIGVGAMVAGINRSISSWVDTTIVGDVFVTAPVNFPADFEEQVLARVAGVDAVSGVSIKIVRFEPGEGQSGRSIALILVDPERFNPQTGFGRFQYLEGDNLTGYNVLRAGGGMLAANTIRDRFGVGMGDTARLRTAEGFRDFPVGGVVVDFTGGGEAFVGSIHDIALFGGGTPDLFVMTVLPGVNPVEVSDALVAAFPELYLDVTLNQTYRERILTLTGNTFATTNSLLFLAVFIAALGVANTLGMNLSNRQHEIAVLRTLGLTRKGIEQLVTAEGVVIILVGTLLGVGSGMLLSTVITAGAAALTGFNIVPAYPWRLILLAIIASPLIGLFASYLPARRASALKPVVALGKAG